METIYNLLHQGFSTIVPFVILLGILIFVHELGHFLVAKFFGVRVEVFSLGFGKKLLQYKKGDTNYCISLVPLGGYVKMFGDEVGAVIDESQKKFSFTHKPVGQRIGVVLAGPLMNFFFAILLFFVIALIGEEVRSPILGDIEPATVAYKDGFRSGDRVVSIDGLEVSTWDDFYSKVNKNYDQNIQIAVLREGETSPITISTTPKLQPNPNVLSMDSFVGEVEGLSSLSKASVVGIQHDSAAHKAGLRTGDRIEEINGKKVSLFREVKQLLTENTQQNIKISATRTDAKGTTANIDALLPKINHGITSSDLFLAKVVDNSPAKKSGLQAGDQLLSINNKTLNSWEDVLNTIKSYSGNDPLKISALRDGKIINVEVVPEMNTTTNIHGGEEKRYTIGIIPTVVSTLPTTQLMKANGLGQAFDRGIKRTWDITTMTVVSFVRLAQGKISTKNIGGVISIGQAAKETFKIGMAHFLQMMAIISVNLFILNLLPIPVLDGGHLLFYTVEAIRGAPLSMRKMEIAQQVGLVLLVSLMVLSFLNDISRLVGAW